jgi:hypothetical protein
MVSRVVKRIALAKPASKSWVGSGKQCVFWPPGLILDAAGDRGFSVCRNLKHDSEDYPPFGSKRPPSFQGSRARRAFLFPPWPPQFSSTATAFIGATAFANNTNTNKDHEENTI